MSELTNRPRETFDKLLPKYHLHSMRPDKIEKLWLTTRAWWDTFDPVYRMSEGPDKVIEFILDHLVPFGRVF